MRARMTKRLCDKGKYKERGKTRARARKFDDKRLKCFKNIRWLGISSSSH